MQTRLFFPVARRAAQHVLLRPIGNVLVQARPALPLREKKLAVGLGEEVRNAIQKQHLARLQLFATLMRPRGGGGGRRPALRVLEIIDPHQDLLVIGNGLGIVGGGNVRRHHDILQN